MSKIVEYVRYFVNDSIGYDVVHFSGQHNLRAHLSKVFDVYKINHIIDVGANDGQFGQFLRSIGYKGDIYSFEPVSDAFKKLSLVSSSDNKWHVYNIALGSSSGDALINVSKHTVFSSLLSPSDYALGRWSESQVDHQEKIIIRTLDEWCAEGNISKSDSVFLKMDTQGFDLEVFKGAKSTLPQVSALLSELSLIAVYDGMPNYMQSLSTYEAAGFSVSGLYPITRNKDLSLNEVDCVLVNISKFEQIKK
ncbi:MAG: FkbM family methyltransferase [Gallionella sp.]|nr:FkbM family methyltransferase [Gallionella sp.]